MDEQTMPELTLAPFGGEIPTEDKPVIEEVSAAVQEQNDLTEEEQKKIAEFSKQIDITNTNMILQYGAGAQQKIADFSDNALQKVKSKDVEGIGNMITDLVKELKGFDANEQPKGLFGRIKKAGNSVTAMKMKYESALDNVNRIVKTLEGHQVVLLKDIAILDQLYEQNLAHFKELNMYILAGKQKLEEVRANDLPALIQKAKLSGSPEDSQRANDLASFCDRFEKKIHDLELTRMVCIQMAPQIRLLQNNDSVMTEKIQSTLTNTIPLWKSQMVIALGLSHSQQAIAAQRQVSDFTNDLLKQNAESLKLGTVETAKEAERGIVDMETLVQTNETLISTLDEVERIQAEGREKRMQAEAELVRIEDQLKDKLLEIKSVKG